MKYALHTQRKTRIGRNQYVRQSNLIRCSTNPFPFEACILVLRTCFFGHIDFDGWEFCVIWATRISFLPELSAVLPFINSFPLEIARNLWFTLIHREQPYNYMNIVTHCIQNNNSDSFN